MLRGHPQVTTSHCAMDRDEARDLAERLVGPLGPRWLHVQRDAATAEALSDVCPAAREQLVLAAWLHDVGYGREANVTGFHPLDGARYLTDLDVEPLIVTLVAHQTGVSRHGAHGMVQGRHVGAVPALDRGRPPRCRGPCGHLAAPSPYTRVGRPSGLRRCNWKRRNSRKWNP
jgi:hypothetical protein